MTTYARLVRAGDVFDGKTVRRVIRWRDTTREHFQERVTLHYADDGRADDLWAEARLNIRRTLA